MIEFFRSLFNTDFMPHVMCLRAPSVIWLHVISDLGIALAYFVIPFGLLRLLRLRRDLSFHWLFVLFAGFILTCGATHILAVVTLWAPFYRFEGLMKAATAVISIVTACALLRLIPHIAQLPSPEQWRRANEQLQIEIAENRKSHEIALQSVADRAEIAERKRNEHALRESLAVSEAALKDLADQRFALDQHAIVAITDPRGTITYVNDKFCDISKYSEAELIGKNHRILNSGYHPKEFFQQMYRTISRGEVWTGEIRNRAKDGSIYWVATTVVPMLDTAGKPRQYVAIRADITERKRVSDEVENLNREMERRNAELEIRVASRTEELANANKVLERSNIELQQFAYVASHDLQSPLRSISGFVQLLKAEYEDRLDQQAAGWIHRVVTSIDQMETLIRDLLAYSRVESRSRPFEPTPLLAVFEGVVGALDSSIRDSHGQVTHGELPVVLGDRGQLFQLMQNLIGNGLKYHGDSPPHVHVSAEREGTAWTVSVRDDGIGIEPKYNERIFEIFQRLHDRKVYPGTGIGLAVCRRVVNRHGGRIWVESEPGRGSAFHFTLNEANSEEQNGRQT
jgi:PAS domain S-box-containing protein